MKPSFACVLRSGGDYLPEHVLCLSEQVKKHSTIDHEFVCYSDMEIPGIKTIKLIKNYPGWWSVPEVFRQKGPTVITGIDTVILQNIDDLFQLALNAKQHEFYMIRAFNPKNKYASGIMAYNGDWSKIWSNFNYYKSIERLNGEQDHTISYLNSINVTPKIIQNHIAGIYSYKKHCRKAIPKDCKVLLFHGKPRPFEVPHIWKMAGGHYLMNGIPRIWPDSTVYILGGGPSLLDSPLHLIHDKNVLGVNQAFSLGDWVDVCYSGDKRWYGWNYKRLKNYKGTMITSYPEFVPFDGKEILNIARISKNGISANKNTAICWNGNSGASAVNVAYWLGAKRIVLLGFDMKRQGQKYNWHNQYPTVPGKKENGRLKSPYRHFLTCWKDIAIDAKKLGIEILNATPEGNLNIFKRVNLEEVV